MTEFFRVKNFDRFQHYKDRSPPWIKLYNDLLDDYEFTCLQDASKAHLIQIWMLASKNNNKLPLNSSWIGQRISATQKVDLKGLIETGFLEKIEQKQRQQDVEQDASTTLAQCKQVAPLGEERREEESTDLQRDKSLATMMFQKIKSVTPKAKDPDFEKWADCIRLMRERDDLTHREIWEVFQWANQDDFWSTNILSPSKLREQFPRLSALVSKTSREPQQEVRAGL